MPTQASTLSKEYSSPSHPSFMFCRLQWLYSQQIQSGPKKCIHSLLINIFGINLNEISISFKFIPKILMSKECIHLFGPLCIKVQANMSLCLLTKAVYQDDILLQET